MDNEEVNFFRVIDVRSYEYFSLASLLSFFVSAQRAWRRGPSGELSLAMRDSQVCANLARGATTYLPTSSWRPRTHLEPTRGIW